MRKRARKRQMQPKRFRSQKAQHLPQAQGLPGQLPAWPLPVRLGPGPQVRLQQAWSPQVPQQQVRLPPVQWRRARSAPSTRPAPGWRRPDRQATGCGEFWAATWTNSLQGCAGPKGRLGRRISNPSITVNITPAHARLVLARQWHTGHAGKPAVCPDSANRREISHDSRAKRQKSDKYPPKTPLRQSHFLPLPRG